MDTNNSENKAGGHVTADRTVVLCGTSRLPANVTTKHVFTIEVEVKPADCRILNFCCTMRLPFGEKILQKALIGYEVEEGIKNAIEQISARFFSNTRKAVIAALRNLSIKYVEYLQSNNIVRQKAMHDELGIRVKQRTAELANTNEKLEAEALHISRLSTIGELASGISHELNQPLCAILTHTNVCLRTIKTGIKDTDRFTKNLETIASQTKFAGEIIRRIRGFARKRRSHRTIVDINEVISEVSGFMESDIRHNGIELKLKPAETTPMVLADSVQLKQVLMNLVRNAIEAMENIDAQERRLTIHTSLASGDMLEVAVSDTGVGLLPEASGRMFESFFSTKPNGLGIGLSISRSIIEAHGGTLSAHANTDGGSRFKFTLPIVKEKVA